MVDKKTYYAQIRAKWSEAKTKTEEHKEEIEARYTKAELPANISLWSYAFVLWQMQALGLEGEPYIDCKTFKRWLEAGYRVNKGEHSKIEGIVWMHPRTKVNGQWTEDTESDYLYPKIYKLFHRSQVALLEEKTEVKTEVKESTPVHNYAIAWAR
jgi:hypothetical protein